MPTTVAWSNYGATLALAATLNRPGLYLALHISDPTTLGLVATEVAGGGYARQPIAFSAPSGKAVVNTIKAYFSGMPAVHVWGLSVWDTLGDSGMIVPFQLPAPIPVAQDGQFRVEVGDIAFQL